MSTTTPKPLAGKGSDFTVFHRIVRPLFPDARLESIRPLEGHSHPVYLLRISGGIELLLKTPPLQSPNVLRHERYLLETEARVLSLLSQNDISYIPKLLGIEIPGLSARSTSYLLRHSIRGVPLSEVEPCITSVERANIERQLGATVHSIGQLTAPQFGLVHSVGSGHGAQTWKQAFLSLLDWLLWDAESVFISLPYPDIRAQTARLSHALDKVSEPQLVILDIGKPSHIIIDPYTRELSGFVDFTAALWGDILMADVFGSASPEFYDGFGSNPTDDKYAQIRLLLYSCYRDTLKIVKQYYQNRKGDEELSARRSLTLNIATLSSLG